MYRVLLLDDEVNVLNSLRRELLSRPDISPDGLEIEPFTLPVKALERAGEKDGYFDVAVVDYRMPAMDGVRFFKEFRQLQPEAVRVLLTANVDLAGAVAAINEAHVDYLVTKPWHEYDLKGRMALALHQRQLEVENRRLADVLRQRLGNFEGSAFRDAYRVMLVDDDENVLRALGRELSEGGIAAPGRHPLFSIMGYLSPTEALRAAEKHPPDLVIADYAMPEMDGVLFFHRLRQHCPDAVRILLSGTANVGVLKEAVNIGGVYHFISKPWEALELKSVLAQAMNYHDVLAANRLLADLARKNKLGQAERKGTS